MYLYAEQYVSGYDFEPDEERKKAYRTIVEASGLAEAADPNTPSLTVSATVAYWRKANAIHAWFVENVQDGVDECQRSYVEREQLQALHDLAWEALAKCKAGDLVGAGALLPPQSGFFFGSTELDDWYVACLEETVKQLKRVLDVTKDKHVSLYYQSSW